MSTVTLQGVRRSYDRTLALQDVTLTAPEAQVLALLGPSGSGKSTILRLIAGLEPIEAGEIRIQGELVSAPGRTIATELRRVGMVFQDYSLFPHLNAGANVAFGLDKLGRAERDETARRWLDRVGLGHRAGAYPHELSGGEQQRVALSRALAPQPRAVDRWRKRGVQATVLAASPYAETDFEAVGRHARDAGATLVVMDCLGYSLAMKAAVTRGSGLPALLVRSLAARVAAELLE